MKVSVCTLQQAVHSVALRERQHPLWLHLHFPYSGGTKDTVTYCLAFILSSLGCWNYSFMMRRVVPHYTASPPPLLPSFSPSLFRLQIPFLMKWNLMNQPFLFFGFCPTPPLLQLYKKFPSFPLIIL